jgi:hypothetical protein
MPKMKIFNSLEKEAFDSPPVFNSAERKKFFSLSVLLNESMADLRTPTNKVCFLTLRGTSRHGADSSVYDFTRLTSRTSRARLARARRKFTSAPTARQPMPGTSASF